MSKYYRFKSADTLCEQFNKFIDMLHIRIRMLEGRIIEVDMEESIGMGIMKEVEVGLEKGNIKVILEGTIEVVVVDLGQDQEWVLIEMNNML